MSTVNSERKKALKTEYRETCRPAGIFQIVSRESGRMYVGASMDLPAIENRLMFQLKLGSFKVGELQRDFTRSGPDTFAFEVLDRVNQEGLTEAEVRRDLESLEVLWLEKLAPYGDRGYNTPRS